MLRHITSTLIACALAGTVCVFAQEPAPAQPEKQLRGGVTQEQTADGRRQTAANPNLCPLRGTD